MVLKKSTSPLQLCHIVVFCFGLFFFLLRFAVRLPARTRRGASASLLPVHSCGEVWDLLTAPVIPSSFVSLTPHCPRGPSGSLDLNPAHQILHNKWSQVRLTYSALPLLPSPRSHRSAWCIGICSPNHGCDTGQSRAQKHTHTDPDARTHPSMGNYLFIYIYMKIYIYTYFFSQRLFSPPHQSCILQPSHLMLCHTDFKLTKWSLIHFLPEKKICIIHENVLLDQKKLLLPVSGQRGDILRSN